jgi:3-deoxy-D-manno-octulosonic-acid transferase
VLRILYVLVAYLLLPVALLALFWRGLANRAYWQRLPERFGYGERLPPNTLWVHAVSVGEVQAAAPLVRALMKRYPERPVLITTVTPTGADRVRLLFGDRVMHRYAPYDLPGAVGRFFDRVQPDLAVIIETELWPTLYHTCGLRGVPLVLASARVSPRSVGRYRRLTALFREALSHGIVIGAQSEADAERFRSIGAHPARTHVTGNIKFDFVPPDGLLEAGRTFREAHFPNRPVWTAGSTHAGEEELVLEAHRRVLADHPDAVLLLVPRHPERFEAVAQLVQKNGFGCARRRERRSLEPGESVFLGDTLGELMTFYAASDVAFLGGSLVPIGGHNLLEPASLGLPILTGMHNFNAQDVADLFVEAGAAELVADADELGAAVGALLGDAARRERMGGRARQALESNRGALDQLLALVIPLVRTGDVAAPPATKR